MAVLFFFLLAGHNNVLAQAPQLLTVHIRPGASNPGTLTPFDPALVSFHLTGTMMVRWINEDNTYHTVTSLTNSFDSQMIAPNGYFDHPFADSGYYDYYCTLHPYMTGAINIS